MKDLKDNKDILSKLFIDFYDDLFRFAKRFEKEEETIKDLIQELFFNLWKKKIALNENENIKSYLFRSLRNIWNNKYNADQRIAWKEFRHEETFVYQPEDFNADTDFSKNQKKVLLSELNNLPEKQREAVYLKYFQGFDIEEISEILNMNRQSVRNNLYRAMTKLRDKLLIQFFLSII